MLESGADVVVEGQATRAQTSALDFEVQVAQNLAKAAGLHRGENARRILRITVKR
jgi:hypothetical protein